MSSMKTGRPKIDTVSVWCPECGEVWTDSPSGSTMLSCDDDLHPGQIVFCQSCRQPYRLPVIIGKLGQLEQFRPMDGLRELEGS